MTPLCSVHTHSALCDGTGTLAEMARAALDAGVRYFGASGHSHTPAPGDQDCVLDTEMAEYRAQVLELREEYAGRMEVLLGLEWDNCSDVSWEGFDYWIGSVHGLFFPETGQYFCVDWERQSLLDCRDRVFHGDFLALAERYYRDVAAVAEKKPTILGHIDLITKLNGDGTLFDETSPRYRNAALEALRAADPAKTALEINTGAVARGYRRAPYPAPFLLRAWRELGGGVILTSDAHRPEHVVYGYGQAAEAARGAGYREQLLLTRAGWITAPL